MIDYNITINNTKIKYSNIQSFIRKGKFLECRQFIVKKTLCSEEDAQEVIDEVLFNIKNNSNNKDFSTNTSSRVEKYIDLTQEKIPSQSNTPKCPKCGSTNFTPVRKKWSLLTGFATNKVEMICNSCGTKVK